MQCTWPCVMVAGCFRPNAPMTCGRLSAARFSHSHILCIINADMGTFPRGLAAITLDSSPLAIALTAIHHGEQARSVSRVVAVCFFFFFIVFVFLQGSRRSLRHTCKRTAAMQSKVYHQLIMIPTLTLGLAVSFTATFPLIVLNNAVISGPLSALDSPLQPCSTHLTHLNQIYRISPSRRTTATLLLLSDKMMTTE